MEDGLLVIESNVVLGSDPVGGKVDESIVALFAALKAEAIEAEVAAALCGRLCVACRNSRTASTVLLDLSNVSPAGVRRG